jgi:hypothetical protein
MTVAVEHDDGTKIGEGISLERGNWGRAPEMANSYKPGQTATNGAR